MQNQKTHLKNIKKYVMALNKKRMILTIVFIDLIFIMLGVLTKNIFFYVGVLLVPVLEYFAQVRPLKKVYYSNKLAIDAVLEYDFYDTYFTKKSAAGEDKIEYSQLSKIVETKTNFYLMIALNQGYMLKKEEMPKGLDEFIRKINLSK